MAANLIFLVETKLCSNDSDLEYELPTFRLFRNDYSKLRSSYGSAVYYKQGMDINCLSLHLHNVEIILLKLSNAVHNIQVASLYCRPNDSVKEICAVITQLKNSYLTPNIPLIIMGDFNVDLLQDNARSKQLLFMMTSQWKN